METRVIITGTSLVLFTSAAAALQVAAPALLPVLFPLSLAVGSTAYLAARPDVRARVVGLLPAPRRVLELPAPAAPDVVPSDLADSLTLQVQAALLQPIAAAPPVLRDLTATPARVPLDLRDTTPPARPVTPAVPRALAVDLEYAPGMAARWVEGAFPDVARDAIVAYADQTPRRLAHRIHEMLVRGDVTIARITLGCAMHEADQAGAWTAMVIICARAPDAVLHDRLCAHVQAVKVQPYSHGGVAVLALLAHPAGVTRNAIAHPAGVTRNAIAPVQPTDTPATPITALPSVVPTVMRPVVPVVGADAPARRGMFQEDVGDDVREQTATVPVFPPSASSAAATRAGLAATAAFGRDAELVLPRWLDAAATDTDDTDETGTLDDVDATGDLDDHSDAAQVPVPVAARPVVPVSPRVFATHTPTRHAPREPAPDLFLQYERTAPAPPTHVADLVTARPVWMHGENLPHVHFGVGRDGALVTGPLKPTCIFAPPQQGKTTIMMHLLHQVLLARDPQTGAGILPWFMTTKWQDTTTHGVDIGRWLRQAYNLKHFAAPCGIEADGNGTYRMLLLLAEELQARLNPGAAPHARPPIVPFIDEWALTKSVLEKKKFKDTGRAKATTGSSGAFNPWELEEEAPKSPFDAASLAVARLIRQGFGERVVPFFATQDAQVQNNGSILNTGVLGLFETFLGHTKSDARTFSMMAKGNPRLRAQIAALIADQWVGWFYVDAEQVVPFTIPHVTNAVIDGWLAELPGDGMRPAPAAPETSAVRVVPALPARPARVALVAEPSPPHPAPRAVTAPVELERWPEAVRGYIARLSPDMVQALTTAFARVGVAIPVRVTEAQRHALIGLGAPDEANRPFIALLKALATKTHDPMSANLLAALVFGSIGRATADIGRAIRAHGEQE